MARLCAVCIHPRRVEIDRVLVMGEPRTTMARSFGISSDSMDRHVKNGHIERKVRAAVERAQVREGESLIRARAEAAMPAVREGASLVEKLQELLELARGILTEAIEAKQY